MLSMESRRSTTTSLSLSDRESTSAWVNLWNTNYGSNPGLRLAAGCENDLTSAIGDKEVAAKAVAFVVNSTRKGIVPLCADVANLLRAKRSLEEKVAQLIRENETLSKGQGLTPLVARSISLSGSTTPLSQQNTTSGTVQELTPTPQVPNSDCVSSAFHSDNDVYNSAQSKDCPCKPVSSTLSSQCKNGDTPSGTCAQAASEGVPLRAHQRHDSLSSCSVESNRSLDVDPSSEAWQTTVQQQLNKTIKLNNKLSEELHAAKMSIDCLNKEVRAYRSMYRNNNGESIKIHPITTSQQHSAPDLIVNVSHHSLTGVPDSCPHCAESRTAYQSIAPPYPLHNSNSIILNESMQASIGDTIDTKNHRTGCVKYIGHMEGFSSTCIFLGIQLKSKVPNGTDGTVNGRKYFSCSKGRGVFIMASDVARIVCKKKITSLSAQKCTSGHSLEQSRSSSSSSSSAIGIVDKLRKAAGNLRHTSSHKRISLPSGSLTNEIAEMSERNPTSPTLEAGASNSSNLPTILADGRIPVGEDRV